MLEKCCTECNINKSIDEFYVLKNGKICARCKTCYSKASRAYRENNKEKVLIKINDWQKQNKEKVNKNKKKWRDKNIDYHKNYYKEKVINDPLYNQKNYLKDVIKNRESVKRFIRNNPEYRKNYFKNKLSKNPNFRIIRNLRQRLRFALKNNNITKLDKTINLLGCSVKELKQYLESKFLPTMTWDNYGKYWQIDHIIPCTKFDLNTVEEQFKCFNYKNLQPLFRITTVINGITYIGNNNKGNKIL